MAVLSHVDNFPCCQVPRSNCLIPRMPHVLKITGRDPQKLISYYSDIVGIDATSNGESPDVLHCLGKPNLPGNEELTESTPNLASKIFPSII